jgi:hypothetical protein
MGAKVVKWFFVCGYPLFIVYGFFCLWFGCSRLMRDGFILFGCSRLMRDGYS